MRRRFDWETRDLRGTYAGILWAAERWFRKDPVVLAKRVFGVGPPGRDLRGCCVHMTSCLS